MNGVRRLELALALLAASAVLVAVIVALDALRWHLPMLLSGTHHAPGGHELSLALLAALDALVLWRLVPSLWRQARLQRRLHALPVLAHRELAGHAVRVVRDSRPLAFCSGLLRPGSTSPTAPWPRWATGSCAPSSSTRHTTRAGATRCGCSPPRRRRTRSASCRRCAGSRGARRRSPTWPPTARRSR